jgi:hypothetical protein
VTRRRLGASLAQRVDEALAIRIIHDDQFAPVTTIHDVRQQTRLSICGLGRESGFGRYTYQYQELTLSPSVRSFLPKIFGIELIGKLSAVC